MKTLRPLVMGILNLTPDSFSDGGRYGSVTAAVERGLEMVQEGADIIDIGGESTQPEASRVNASEQLRRVHDVWQNRQAADVAWAIRSVSM
ncbi:MAG: dihydropteroate synthase [Candidatus Thiodiazotropha sp. (ex Rostrolucina anterorostrata)]|nr:dihydropteroate synthase [Candidatus Thiodiazotropha sp. (ex Rostrolucina anterorostrata)]